MDVRNCKKCGRIFNYMVGIPVCPACREKLEKKFQEVKDFIRDNRKAGLQEIAETCEVDIPQIRQWVREERLVFTEDSAVGIECESCGTMIRTGRFCEKCKAEMTMGLRDAIKMPERELPRKKDRENPKMRFLDQDR